MQNVAEADKMLYFIIILLIFLHTKQEMHIFVFGITKQIDIL